MKKIGIVLIGLFLLNIAYSQEKQVITSDSVALYVNIKGKGTPCLYIHGGPGSGSYWLEQFFGDYLEQHFQMIYLDQRGVGRSGSPTDKNYSLNRMVQDFEEVRNALGIKQCLTLGHSFGGILQAAYVQSFPQSNMGMMMINCTLNMQKSFCESWIPHANEILGVTDTTSCPHNPEALFIKMSGLIESLNEKDLMWKMAYANQKNQKAMNATYGAVANWNNNFGNVAITISDYWKDFGPETRDIQVPVLFFYGQSDWMVGPEHYKAVYFPNMLLWSSNVGHMPFQENHADLEKAISAYLSKYNF